MKFFTGKIDAFSCVFENHSLLDVSEFLGITDKVTGFFNEAVPTLSAYMIQTQYRLIFENIVFEFPVLEYNNVLRNSPDCIMTENYSKIRLALMGKGLDYLRSLNIDVDTVLRKRIQNMHVTRVDFAFDFINRDYDIIKCLHDFLYDKPALTAQNRLSIQGLKAGLSYTQKYGSSEKTIYLGSSAGERMLRIYDKKLEQSRKTNGILTNTDFGNPSEIENWTRVEWQLRKEAAMKILYNSDGTEEGYKAILKALSDFYQIIRVETGRPLQKWADWFSTDSLNSLIYKNANFVPKRGTAERNDTYIEDTVITNLLIYVLRHGEERLIYLLRNKLKQIQTIQNDDILESIRLATLFKVTKALCECSPTGTLDGIVKLENNKIVYPGFYQ